MPLAHRGRLAAKDPLSGDDEGDLGELRRGFEMGIRQDVRLDLITNHSYVQLILSVTFTFGFM